MPKGELTPALGQRGPAGTPLRPLLVLGGWALLIGGVQLYAWQNMLNPLKLLQGLVLLCQGSPIGPLLFIGAAALSPLLLVPAALLGAVAGICFGPWLGVLYTIIGCNLSATLTYSLGRLSERGMRSDGMVGRMLARYGPRLRKESFLSVIMLRLSFLPYDPINCLIGMARIGWLRFMAANTLGSLPGVIAIVLAGASVEGLDQGLPMFNPMVLLSAVLLLLLSLGGALALRRAQPLTGKEPLDDR